MRFFPTQESARTEQRPPEQYCMEFLTPLVGGRVDRAGGAVTTKEIQKGVTAQRLRYLDLLMVESWRVPLAVLPGMGGRVDERIRVKLPHPGLFVVHKVLVSGEVGRREKRAKDMAFIYEVLALFRRDMALLAQEVHGISGKSATWRWWLKRFKQRGAELFGTPSAAGVTEAHAALAGSAAGGEVPTLEMIYAGVQAFLRQF
jgi:hypothetical protein